MAERKTPILLRRAPLSGSIVAVHRYRRRRDGTGMVDAAINGKQDVSGDFDALLLEELLCPDAMNIIGILAGIASGQPLTEGERAEVRAFCERLKRIAERHNARQDGAEPGGER